MTDLPLVLIYWSTIALALIGGAALSQGMADDFQGLRVRRARLARRWRRRAH